MKVNQVIGMAPGFQKLAVQSKKYPKGFDITLADAMSIYMLSEDQVRRLGTMTANRSIPFAILGGQAYYRRSTIEEMIRVDAEQAKAK